MEINRFNTIIKTQIQKCQDTLIKKEAEYATEDRLHNFNVSSELQGISQRQALAGMMAKHTTSIYDMCWSKETFSEEQWNEKITDHINYLLLLRAVVDDEIASNELQKRITPTDPFEKMTYCLNDLRMMTPEQIQKSLEKRAGIIDPRD